jgi:hypothetical protein
VVCELSATRRPASVQGPRDEDACAPPLAPVRPRPGCRGRVPGQNAPDTPCVTWAGCGRGRVQPGKKREGRSRAQGDGVAHQRRYRRVRPLAGFQATNGGLAELRARRTLLEAQNAQQPLVTQPIRERAKRGEISRVDLLGTRGDPPGLAECLVEDRGRLPLDTSLGPLGPLDDRLRSTPPLGRQLPQCVTGALG